MNIDDYKKAAERMKIRPECKGEIISMSINKNREKQNKAHIYGKKRIIPVIIAAAAVFTVSAAVFADDFTGIFRKQGNVEMNISSFDTPATLETSSTAAQIPIISADYKKWDENIIMDIFAKDKAVTNTEEYQSDADPDTTRKVFEFDDNSMLAYENGDIEYTSRSVYDYEYLVSKQLYSINSGEYLFKDGNIDGLDKNEISAQVDTILNQLGIQAYSKEILALDKDSMIAQDDVRNENGERIYKHGEVLPEYTEEQEAYMIICKPMAGNLPISLSNDTQLNMVISRNGLEVFTARWIYEAKEELKNVDICSAESAADAVMNKYNNETSPFSIDIFNCSLVYIAVPVDEEKTAVEMKPVWEFYTTEHNWWFTDEEEELKHREDKTYDNTSAQKEYLDFHNTIYVDAQNSEVIEDFSDIT